MSKIRDWCPSNWSILVCLQHFEIKESSAFFLHIACLLFRWWLQTSLQWRLLHWFPQVTTPAPDLMQLKPEHMTSSSTLYQHATEFDSHCNPSKSHLIEVSAAASHPLPLTTIAAAAACQFLVSTKGFHYCCHIFPALIYNHICLLGLIVMVQITAVWI